MDVRGTRLKQYNLQVLPKHPRHLEGQYTRRSSRCERELSFQYVLVKQPTFATDLGLLAYDHALKNSGTLVDTNLACELWDSRFLESVLSEHWIQLSESVTDLVD